MIMMVCFIRKSLFPYRSEEIGVAAYPDPGLRGSVPAPGLENGRKLIGKKILHEPVEPFDL
jgi:hypothetical protein